MYSQRTLLDDNNINLVQNWIKDEEKKETISLTPACPTTTTINTTTIPTTISTTEYSKSDLQTVRLLFHGIMCTIIIIFIALSSSMNLNRGGYLGSFMTPILGGGG